MIWKNRSGGEILRKGGRSVRVYRCEICHTRTNKWHMGGWPGKGPRLLCPGGKYEEHDELESVLERYDELETLFGFCNSIDREKMQGLNELPLLIDLLEEKVEKLRKKFPEEANDVKGVGSDAEIKSYYPSTRYSGEKKNLYQ